MKQLFLGLLGLSLLLTQLVVPASAGTSPDLVISPNAGPRGTVVTVKANGLDASTTYLLQLVKGTGNINTTRVFETTVTSDGSGALGYQLTIDQEIGAYTVRIVSIGGTVLATAPFTVVEPGSAPKLTVTPDQGPCGSEPTMQGHDFPAGSTVTITMEQKSPTGQTVGTAKQVNQVQASPSGDTIAFTLPPLGSDCGTPDKATPEGTHFIFTAVASGPGIPTQDAPTANAAFRVGKGSARYFPETGFSVQGRFLDYWRAHGLDLGDEEISDREALTLFGYPISGEFPQRLEDGNTYTVQYFERARFEHHPENAGTPYEVLLGQFGRQIVAGVPGAPTGQVQATGQGIYFPETGHNVAPPFSLFWQHNGGLALFGYPLSEPFTQQLEDGNTYTVQYFERARFESHPENAGTPYEVLLGQFGRQILGTADTPR